MNAGAYGGDWARDRGAGSRRRRRRRRVAHAATQLGLRYRHSQLEHGQVVARVEFRLTPRPTDEIKATVADLQAQRKAAQPTNKRTYGSVFKNPGARADRGPDARGLRSEGPPNRGRADLAPSCELHRERRRSSLRRRGGADGGGPAPRQGAVRRDAPARGRVPRPDRASVARRVGPASVAAKSGRMSEKVLPLRARTRVDVLRFVPSGRSFLLGGAIILVAAGLYGLARESSMFAAASESRSRARHPTLAARCASRSARIEDGASSSSTERRPSSIWTVWPPCAASVVDRAFPHTLRVRVVPEVPVAVLRRGADSWLVSARGRVIGAIALGDRQLAAAHLAAASDRPSRSARCSRTSRAGSLRARSQRSSAAASRSGSRSSAPCDGQITLGLRGGLEVRLGAPDRPRAEDRHRPPPRAGLRAAGAGRPRLPRPRGPRATRRRPQPSTLRLRLMVVRVDTAVPERTLLRRRRSAAPTLYSSLRSGDLSTT